MLIQTKGNKFAVIFSLFALLLIPLFSVIAEDAMTIASTAFEEGGQIPEKYSCKGANVSPPLEWSGAPDDTVSFVLICDDPDAPIGTWVHWVCFNIPADVSSLPEDVPAGEKPEMGGVQGRNGWRKNSYGGPCPPSGTHRYYFKLYALDTMLDLRSRANKKKVVKAMKGHILDEAQLMGTFSK